MSFQTTKSATPWREQPGVIGVRYVSFVNAISKGTESMFVTSNPQSPER
jgi:hypothetical protein